MHDSQSAPSSASGPPFAIDVVRGAFPTLHQNVHGRPLVYLDSAATTQKPQRVIDAVNTFYSLHNANVHRGVHALSQRATELYEGARERVRKVVGAERTRDIVFTRGTTEALNLLATSLGSILLEPGDEVLISWMEHHSNIVPWQMACQRTGAVLKVIPINNRGELDMARFAELLSPRTKIVSVVHTSNVLGTINPVDVITRMAHEVGAAVVIDGAQAVAHDTIDVAALGCDFFVFSGHKMYAPTGIGVLYARGDWLERMPPYQGGGDMILSVAFEGSTYADPPYKFEAGTPNIAGAIGLGAAIDWMEETGIEAMIAHEERLLAEASERLVTEVPGLRIIGTAERKAAVISFVLDKVHPHDIGTIVDTYGVAIRTGHHCAQPVMEFFGIPATARASFAAYNTSADIDALIVALLETRRMFG